MTTVLGHRYRLHALLAAGGMGEVWRATDEMLDREVAIKVLRRELVADPGARERFRDEARIAAMLLHPNIARVYDLGEDGDLAYLVMELVTGDPLAEILRRNGTLRPEATLDLVGQAARALEHAHRAGIVHRDVKPGNLLITEDGTLKVTDFGIAQTATSSRLTATGTIMGTVQYVSPEQADGRPAGTASDLYSLGIVAYECLAGAVPFDAETPVAVAVMHLQEPPGPLPEDVPDATRALVEQLLSKDPLERPGSAGNVAERCEDLRQAMISLREATEELPESPVRPLDPERHSRALLTCLTAGVAVLGVLTGAALVHKPTDATLSGDDRRTTTETPVTPGSEPVSTGKPSVVPVKPRRTAPVTIPATPSHPAPDPASTTPRALGSDDKV
ncbi:serine/threonine-protein kinase [Actinocorallia longicatena]|uniref:non-specific serine/threonine protein kinase n=1 Tax=Actinocorallia longicatena TaxID=111803 RepID=A0ABP6Q9L8_9ACTN